MVLSILFFIIHKSNIKKQKKVNPHYRRYIKILIKYCLAV